MISDFSTKFGRREKRIVKVDDVYPAQVTIAANATDAVVVTVKCPPNLRPILKKVGNAINDATGSTFITWSLQVNGGKWANFEKISNMITDPAKGDQMLPYESPLPTGCMIELTASSTDATNTHPVIGRVTVYYEDLD